MSIWDRRLADEAAMRLAAGAVGYALSAPIDDIIGQTRGSSETAFARQVTMYLCHVVFEWSLARVAETFGRDRSTVAHACHTIEDRRDDDAFDDWISALEQSVRAAQPARGARP